MTKAKKTQTSNAMKPEKLKEAVDQTNADTAQANEENKAAETETTGSAEGSEGAADVVDRTGDKLPESEQSPTPDQRQAEAGTKTKAEKKAEASAEDDAQEDKPKTLKDRDLSNPQDVGELVEEILETIVSLGHPIAGALNSKPKVGEVWGELVAKAKAVKTVADAEKEKRASKK